MATDRVRAFRALQYHDPREVLVKLRAIELTLAGRTDVPDAVKHLRTQDLKPLRELREACLFCYGWSQIDGRDLHVAHAESQDYDAVASWFSDEQLLFAPLQIKEVVPQHLNAHTSVPAIIDKLTKYTSSQDLTVVIHLNRRTSFSLAELVVPPLKIAALWVFGALDAQQTRWMIWGNLLEAPQWREFRYPE
jgi:hypothetical protein